MITRPGTIAVLALTWSCGLFDGESERLTIRLPFCDQAAIPIVWAAVKHEGGNWTSLSVTDGSATLEATARLTVAYGNNTETRVYSATAQELSEASCAAPAAETRVLQGFVRDVAANERFVVSVGPATVNSTPFAVFVPNGALTLVARTEDTQTGAPRRLIVRHNVDLPSGAEMPVLYFSSGEAKAFESATATVSGGGGFTFLSNELIVPGNRHVLWGAEVQQGTAQFFGAPEALLGPDDSHVMALTDFSGNTNTIRQLRYHYRRARNVTLVLGPAASETSGTVITTTPCTRLRATIASQAAYPSFAVSRFQLSEFGNNSVVEVGVSRDFLGQTPATWTLDVPDLTAPNGSCLLGSTTAGWSVTTQPFDGRFSVYLGARGRDGELLRWSPSFSQ